MSSSLYASTCDRAQWPVCRCRMRNVESHMEVVASCRDTRMNCCGRDVWRVSVDQVRILSDVVGPEINFGGDCPDGNGFGLDTVEGVGQ